MFQLVENQLYKANFSSFLLGKWEKKYFREFVNDDNRLVINDNKYTIWLRKDGVQMERVYKHTIYKSNIKNDNDDHIYGSGISIDRISSSGINDGFLNEELSNDDNSRWHLDKDRYDDKILVMTGKGYSSAGIFENDDVIMNGGGSIENAEYKINLSDLLKDFEQVIKTLDQKPTIIVFDRYYGITNKSYQYIDTNTSYLRGVTLKIFGYLVRKGNKYGYDQNDSFKIYGNWINGHSESGKFTIKYNRICKTGKYNYKNKMNDFAEDITKFTLTEHSKRYNDYEKLLIEGENRLGLFFIDISLNIPNLHKDESSDIIPFSGVKEYYKLIKDDNNDDEDTDDGENKDDDDKDDGETKDDEDEDNTSQKRNIDDDESNDSKKQKQDR